MNGQTGFGNEDFLIKCEPYLTTTTTTTTVIPSTIIVSTMGYLNNTGGAGTTAEEEEGTTTPSLKQVDATVMDQMSEQTTEYSPLIFTGDDDGSGDMEDVSTTGPREDDLIIIPGNTEEDTVTKTVVVNPHNVPEDTGISSRGI